MFILVNMPSSRRLTIGEALITTTLFSIYIGTRGTARAIGAIESLALRA